MPTPSNFSSRVPHVTPGSPLTASNTSQATRALEQRTNYLKTLLENNEAGQLLSQTNQPLDPEVEVGDAVFWDAAEKRFSRALAAVGVDDTTGTLQPLASADCLGICIAKTGPVAGTIGNLGTVYLPPDVVASMLDGSPGTGRYYLSASSPGKLVQQRPPVTVAVAHVLGPADGCEDGSWVYINPQMRDFLEDHIHYQIELVSDVAGVHVPPSVGELHEIASPDAELPGWLPADHESFAGNAPAGAKFGYNMAAHPALSQLWPPIPLSAAILEIKQHNMTAPDEYIAGLQRVPSEYYQLDATGIWWMTDCFNQVPWDTLLDTNDTNSSSLSMEDCPPDLPTQVILSFLKMTFATDKSVVTSLQPAANQPLAFRNCSGVAATTGDLYASLTVETSIADEQLRGGQVLKTVTDPSLAFRRGWVAEALWAGSEEVILSGSHQELLDPDAAESAENPMLHQGIIRVDVQPDTGNREISPQIIKLADAIEREYKGVTYLGFPPSRTSSIRMRFNVPPSGLPDSPKMEIRVVMLGRTIGPWCAMTLSYYRITRPVAGAPVALGTGDTALTFDVVTPTDNYNGVGGNLPADNVIEVTSSQFTVQPGDTVFVELARSSSASPLYVGEIGAIRIGGIIVPGV